MLIDWAIHAATRHLFVGVSLASAVAVAQVPTELEVLNLSADIDIRFPGDTGTLFASDHSMVDIVVGSNAAVGSNWLGDIGGADIDAFQDSSDGCGSRLFSVDSTIELPGGIVGPADLFDDFGTVFFDASAQGLPAGVNIDAVSRDPETCELVFSIDVTTDLGGAAYRPGDLIAWNPDSGFSMYRLDTFGVDIDGLQLLEGGRYLISTATDRDIGDLRAFDDQVVEVIPAGPGTVQLVAYSPRSIDATWIAADVDALAAKRRLLPGTFRWLVAEVSVLEDQAQVGVTVERSGGTDGIVELEWSSAPGTATESEDYVGAGGTITFDDGDRFAGVAITLLDDSLLEGDETFTITLSNPTGGATIGIPDLVTVTIIDDEDFIFADGFEGP